MRSWIVLSVALLTGVAVWSAAASAQERPPQPPQQPPQGPSARPQDPARRDLGAYRLRVEDEVEVAIYKTGSFDTSLTKHIVVPANGEISFAPIGRLNLLGKTTWEIEEFITARLKDENIVTNPNVGCFVMKYAPRTVSVIGAVRASVEMPVHKDLRVLELLSRVGGLDAPDADFSHVSIRRPVPDGRPFTFEVNVDVVFRQNDEQQNVVIKEGDIVYIPRLETSMPQSSDFVYMLGKIGQKGRIPIVRGRYPFTLVRLISICGDFSEFADRSKVKVIRMTETGRQTFVVDFDDIIEGKRPDFEMKPDDIVFVPESFL
ncbi:MAG: polysaccharide biosynthesis/export family protein [Planctomycetes bacterium]|nr:polysaccharide biosynthesis/export family protein [Planctomycetota bacterium]